MSKSRRKKTKPIIKKELNEKEKKILGLAKVAWNKTLKEFYYPPLNEPRFVFDYTHSEGFYIDPEHRWQITMNLAQSPPFTDDQEYTDYFHAISLHEVSHYQIIPYDGLINAKLLRAAMKHVNQYFAPIVVNCFADLLIDTRLFKRHPELMLWEVQKTYQNILDKNKGKFSDFLKFLFRAYEKLWKVNISVDDSLSSMENLADRVVKVVLKNFEDEASWEEKVTKIAYHLRGLINDTFTLIGRDYNPPEGKVKRKSPGKGDIIVEIPEDVLEVMDNPLENKNSDKLKEDHDDELRQKAEQFAKDTPFSEFGAPANQAGILIEGNHLATWYRGIAKNLIEIKIYEEKLGGQLPVFPEVWRVGEPLEELDIVQTILTSPIIIPNITTRKWLTQQGTSYLEDKQIPDLLIVIDSSGSMNWNYTSKSAKGAYHTALLSSFAALHYAAKKGVKFSIINFSNRADTCDWTKNYLKAEEVLLRYQGGGTHLPVKAIVKQCEKAENKSLVFIITDFGIYNWSASKKTLLDLVEKGHKVVGFFIGSSKIPKEKFKSLLDKVTFYAVKNIKDLIDLVIQEVKRYYI